MTQHSNYKHTLWAALAMMPLFAGSACAAASASGTGAGTTIPFFWPGTTKIDTQYWYISNGWVDGAYESCEWLANALSYNNGNLQMTLSNKGGPLRPLGCPEIQTNLAHGYGVYEARMRTSAGSGLNTAFFTYVGKPWDEIDMEFLGKNSHTVQLNYYTNGKGGHEVLIQLGFDASAAFHNYKIDWQPTYIAWYVDEKLVYQTPKNAVLPSHAGKTLFSLWSGEPSLNAWLGPLHYKAPVTAEVAWITYAPNP